MDKEYKGFTTNKAEFKNDAVVYMPELLVPVEYMDDDKLYQVNQIENMVDENRNIIGSVMIRFKAKNGQLIVTDEKPDEVLTFNFTNNTNK